MFLLISGNLGMVNIYKLATINLFCFLVSYMLSYT